MESPDQTAREAVLRRGPTALAWEVLRRDPAYRAAHAALAAAPHPEAAASPNFVARWGLHFR
ncbi:transcriptional regulator domain-containing protein [Sphingobium sp. CFD-1]|uniref:transcriptional regulator domain-containing protein n=1 Tax=Sphingobium sp. CFD-1 TaxID=2878545 RepID=UPI00214B5954|nr:DUF6499 domain-containing protein [Sphingobium sp. CFD-1]